MARIILIRGNSGSGKTSLAKRLQEHLGENTMLLSQDDIRRHILKAKDGPTTPTIPLLISMIQTGQTFCETIIIEGILVANWYQPLWDFLDKNFTNNVHAYYYDLTFEETLLRHATRAKAKDFGEADMKRWFVPKDYLNRFLETRFDATISLEKAMEIILNQTKPTGN